MKKRQLEPPKLPWSKNKIGSNPNLRNSQAGPELPGSKSLMSLDSSFPPEMIASSLSDSPKVLKASTVVPLKGKEEALSQMVTKWRAKVTGKRQHSKTSKIQTPPSSSGGTKMITITTTSSSHPQSTLNSLNSLPIKSSVIFLANKNRVVSKAKDSVKTSAKTDLNAEDSLSGIPVTSGPINVGNKLSGSTSNVKRKPLSCSLRPHPPTHRDTPRTKTDLEINLQSLKTSATITAQAKSSSLNSLVNASNSIFAINSSKTKHKPSETDKGCSQAKQVIKSLNLIAKAEEQSKRFHEKRPKSSIVERSVHKPLTIYMNEPRPSQVVADELCPDEADLHAKRSNPAVDIQGANEISRSDHVQLSTLEKESSLNEDFHSDKIFGSQEISDSPANTSSSDRISSVMDDSFTAPPDEPPTGSQESDNKETEILETSLNVSNHGSSSDLLNTPVSKTCENIRHSSGFADDTLIAHVPRLTESTISQEASHLDPSSIRPSFPLCSSPSPSFTSSDNSDNDWDESDVYKKSASQVGAKVFEFWFDQESTIDDDDDDDDNSEFVNPKIPCLSPLDEITGKNSRVESSANDQTCLIELLKRCQLETDHKVNQGSDQSLIGNQYKVESLSCEYFTSSSRQQLNTRRPTSVSQYLNPISYLDSTDRDLNSSKEITSLLDWLKMENGELDSRSSQLSRENSSLTELLKISRTELEQSDLRNKQNKAEFEMELDQLRSEKERLLNELHLPERERVHYVAMEQEIDALKRQIIRMESSHSEAEQEVKELKKELEEAKLESEEMRDRFSVEDNRELRRLREDFDCCVRECRLLQFKNRQSEKKCDLFRARVCDLEASLSLLTPSNSPPKPRGERGDDASNHQTNAKSRRDSSPHWLSSDSMRFNGDGPKQNSSGDYVERLKAELREAREVSIRLHEECERLTRDSLVYRREEFSALERSGDTTSRLEENESLETVTIPAKDVSTNEPECHKIRKEVNLQSEDRNRREELEIENKRLMEVLVYLRRKLESRSDVSQGTDKLSPIDVSVQSKFFQHSEDNQESIYPSSDGMREENVEGGNTKASVSPSDARPLHSPAIENKESSKNSEREKIDQRDEPPAMNKHRQEMNSLLQTLRRKECQFSEERKVMRRKNQELSEMLDLLADRVANKNPTTISRECQTELEWSRVEERMCRLEAELEERISSELLSRGRHEDIERELNERISGYEEKLNSLQEKINRKCKTIERKEQMIARLTCSANEAEKSLTEKCWELEEKDRACSRTSVILLEMEEDKIKQESEIFLLKAKLIEAEERLNLADESKESLQEQLKVESHVTTNCQIIEASHLRETKNLNIEVHEALPVFCDKIKLL